MRVGEHKKQISKEEVTMSHKRALAVLLMLLSGAVGCATKNYVRQQVVPIINKVNDLDDLTAQNTRSIRETDERSRMAVQQAQASADGADQKAQTAAQQAQRAQSQAENADDKVSALQTTVATIDEYRVVKEVTVQFATSKYELTDEAKRAIGEMAGNSRDLYNTLIVIEGFTDSTGNAADNYSLSSRRASSIRQYLASEYKLPSYKIHVIGLGEDKPVASNRTPDGRAQNRRANVQLMSNRTDASARASVTR